MNLTVRDKKVINAFINRQADSSKKLESTGERLNGNWFGGTGIASWQGNKIAFHDLGSRSAQTVQRYIEKKVGTAFLVRNPSSGGMTPTGRHNPATSVQYEVDLGSPAHMEEVRLYSDGTATLYRFTRPVVSFTPSSAQIKKIQSGRGKLRITSSMITTGHQYTPSQGGRHNPSPPLDMDAARDLKLYIENDGELYRQYKKPADMNLSRKWKKGTYDEALAAKGYKYLVEAGAKKYVKDFGGDGKWHEMFPKNVRDEVARQFAEEFTEEAKLGNLTENPRISAGVRNPASFTKKGNRMMRHIEQHQTPGIAAATVHAAAKRGVPGLVKKKRNPAESDALFVIGAAKAEWASLFSTELYNLYEDGYDELADELDAGPGEDLMDYLPPLPDAAYKDAEAFEAAVVKANGVRDIYELMDRARAADKGQEVDSEEFGHYLMMSALGEGAGWFDNHGDFDLHLPHWEQSSEIHSAMYDYLEEKKSEYEDEEDE